MEPTVNVWNYHKGTWEKTFLAGRLPIGIGRMTWRFPVFTCLLKNLINLSAISETKEWPVPVAVASCACQNQSQQDGAEAESWVGPFSAVICRWSSLPFGAIIRRRGSCFRLAGGRRPTMMVFPTSGMQCLPLFAARVLGCREERTEKEEIKREIFACYAISWIENVGNF